MIFIKSHSKQVNAVSNSMLPHPPTNHFKLSHGIKKSYYEYTLQLNFINPILFHIYFFQVPPPCMFLNEDTLISSVYFAGSPVSTGHVTEG